MIYMAILYSSGKRRRFWSCYATTLGFWDGATRTLDPGFQAARDGDLDQLHLGCIQATLPNFGVWEWGGCFWFILQYISSGGLDVFGRF
jgi:hypothetical protein